MIVNNTLIAIAAGAGLIGVALFLRMLRNNKPINSEGWAGFFGVVGLILAVLGLATCIMWPYGGGGFEYANIAFGEPAAAFGALSLLASVYLWRNRALFAGTSQNARTEAVDALKPVSIFVFVLGLAMTALAFAWVRFQLGAAPEFEPISGNFAHLPWLEAAFLGGLWGIVALGCLLFPFAVKNLKKGVATVTIWAFLIGGVVFSLFGAMNFYTHIGMYTNINKGTNYKF